MPGLVWESELKGGHGLGVHLDVTAARERADMRMTCRAGVLLGAWRETMAGRIHFAMRPYRGGLVVVPIGGITMAVRTYLHNAVRDGY